jgi:hypothetical protein
LGTCQPVDLVTIACSARRSSKLCARILGIATRPPTHSRKLSKGAARAVRMRVKGILKNLATGEGTSATSTAIISSAEYSNDKSDRTPTIRQPNTRCRRPANATRCSVRVNAPSATNIRGMRAHGIRKPRICAASFRKAYLPSSLVANEALRYDSTRVETCASVDNHTQSNWITPTTSLPLAVEAQPLRNSLAAPMWQARDITSSMKPTGHVADRRPFLPDRCVQLRSVLARSRSGGVSAPSTRLYCAAWVWKCTNSPCGLAEIHARVRCYTPRGQIPAGATEIDPFGLLAEIARDIPSLLAVIFRSREHLPTSL